MKLTRAGRLVKLCSLVATCVAAPALGVQPDPGAERTYRISTRGTSHVDLGLMTAGVSKAVGAARPSAAGTTQLQAIRFDLSAELHSRVVAVDEKGWTESARLQKVAYQVDDTLESRVDLLSTPFLVRYERSGRIAEFTFPRRFPTELRSVIQRMVEPLQVVEGEAGASTWQAQERDLEVAYTARYQRSAAFLGAVTLTKVKTQVRPVALEQANLPLPGRPVASVDRSEAVIELDAAGLPARVTAKEKVTTLWGRAFFSDYDSTYEAIALPAPSAVRARTLLEAQAGLADPVFARARFYDVEPSSLQLVRGLDLATAMTTYRAAVVDKAGLGARLLKSWLRLNPAKSALVARQIDALDPKLDENAFEFGWAALASAGHLEAQQALLQVVTTPGWKPASKEQALISMMSLEAPEPQLARAVWAERSALAAKGRGTGLEMSIVTNVYGAMGDVEKGNPALTAEVVTALAGVLAKSDLRSQVLALDALSNVGDLAKVAPLAAPHLVSAHPQVRAAAFSTFRRMGGDAAFEKFAAAFAREADAQVREKAVRIARQMPASDRRNQWATAIVANEPTPVVQSQLVLILGRALKEHPENATTLQGLLKTVRDRSVRKEIYAFVAPGAVKGGTP